MTPSNRPMAFLSGVLCANSLPHLATAAAGRRHLTPLRGRDSSRLPNALWGAANLAGGLTIIGRTARGGGRWDSRLVAFNLGAAVFAAWATLAERTMTVNWDSVPAPGGVAATASTGEG